MVGKVSFSGGNEYEMIPCLNTHPLCADSCELDKSFINEHVFIFEILILFYRYLVCRHVLYSQALYNTEAEARNGDYRGAVSQQYDPALWLGITWPSAVLTWYSDHGYGSDAPPVAASSGDVVVLLYLYHFSLHILYKEQRKGISV